MVFSAVADSVADHIPVISAIGCDTCSLTSGCSSFATSFPLQPQTPALPLLSCRSGWMLQGADHFCLVTPSSDGAAGTALEPSSLVQHGTTWPSSRSAMLFFTRVLLLHCAVVLLYGALQKQRSEWEVLGEDNLRAIPKKRSYHSLLTSTCTENNSSHFGKNHLPLKKEKNEV